VLLLGCTGGVSQQEALLPQSMKDKIITRFNPKSHQNVQFEVTGEGTLLPNDQNRGIDKIICFKVRYEAKQGDKWVPGVNSEMAQRIGNDWSLSSFSNVERVWNQHSCPRPFEFVYSNADVVR
jgi:hypothetical protein